MIVVEEAEIYLAFSVWARGGQAPLRVQTSLFTDLLVGGPAVLPRAPSGAVAARAAA